MANVLIIEDQEELGTLLQEKISESGHVVTVVETGESALKQMEDAIPDAIVLDIVLPGMSGVEFLEAIKGVRESKEIAVFALSNLDSPGELKAVRAFGVKEYFVKTDWRIDDIVSKIKESL